MGFVERAGFIGLAILSFVTGEGVHKGREEREDKEDKEDKEGQREQI